MFDITIYPSLYDIDSQTKEALTWGELVSRLTTHAPIEDKAKAPLFGPYALTAPATPCRKHRNASGEIVTRTGPHKCGSCASFLSLAVFDVDQGSEADAERCEDALHAEGIARIWYTTFSHRPSKPSFRLVLPLERPLPASSWRVFRAELLSRFSIPADPKTSVSPVQAYFLPSHLPKARQPFANSVSGRLLAVSDEHLVIRPTYDATDFSSEDDGDFEWGDASLTVEEARRRISEKVSRDKRGTPEKKYNASLLERLLDGQPLEEHGRRNESMRAVTNILGWMFPEAPLEVFEGLLEPSLLAMMNEGSKLTPATTLRMLKGAVTNARREEEFKQNLFKTFEEKMKALNATERR